MPSSSEGVSRAMRRQPKRFSRNYLRRKGGDVILDVLVSFKFIPKMFSSLSAAFLHGRAFACFSARLAVHYLAVYSVLRSLIKQNTTAMTTSTMVV